MLCMGVCVVHGGVMHGEVCTLGMLCMGGMAQWEEYLTGWMVHGVGLFYFRNMGTFC